MRAVGYKPSALVADTGRMPTKSLWDGIPWTAIQDGEREGWVFFDDFINMPQLDVGSADDTIYASHADTGTQIAQGAASEYGELEIILDATDNDEGWIQTGGQTGGMAKFILQATAVPHTIAFECRVKKSSITTGGFFVGFAEEGLAAVNTIADAGTIADKDYIGFFTPEADADGMDFVYNKAGGANPTIAIADIHTHVADTYVKVGFLYNYKNADDKQIKAYMNGVRNGTYVTKTLIDNTTNFPGGEEMALLFGGKNSTAATNTFTMDWWKAALVVNS